ncbi:uncharacterized protein LOC141907801 [Tubulanus polymorphus]|uniref:uncharacterized protein LOC141907801 n=1 Tax=Tubulanus polymorphus TaxID=672921 RepID=UPI003DA43E52
MAGCVWSPLKICTVVVSIFAVGCLLFSFMRFNFTEHKSLAIVGYKNVIAEPNTQMMLYLLGVKDPDSPEMPCTTRKTKYSGVTPICVYQASVDTVVSKAILTIGAWEPHLTELMEELFRRDPNLNLFDFGSNVGAFTITALKSGRKVVAVDPKAGNLRRIRMSIHKGNLTGAVLVQNGLSDFRTTATFHQDPGNNG